jgi:hypothetical protein
MNWFSLFAVLLLVTQTPVPATGKASNSSADARSSVKTQSKANQQTSDQATTIDQPNNPPSSYSDGSKETAENREQSVKILQIPPISLTRDAKSRLDHVFDWGPWIANFFLVLVGAGQLALLYETWKKVSVQTKTMEDALKATRESNAAIRQIADENTASSIRIQRAYVLPRTRPVPAIDDAGRLIGWRCKVDWENVGKTPAVRIQLSLKAPIIREQDYVSASDCPYNPDGKGSSFDIAPGYPATSLTEVFPMPLMLDVQSQKVFLFLWGWAEYSSVFDLFPRFRTEFCIKMNPAGDVLRSDCVFAWRQTGPHNGIDETCLHSPKTDPYREAPYSEPPQAT